MTTHISEKIPKIAFQKSIFVKMGDNEVLFAKVKNGDEVAFEILFKSFYASLTHFANAYLQDLDEAEEIVQSIFVNIWEKKEHIIIETSFKSYIYQSVKNKCLNYLRNKKTQSKHLTIIDAKDYEDDHAIESMSSDEINQQLYFALEELPPKCKQIFQLSRLEGLKHKDIAEKLDLKVKTIENQIGIALKFLRTKLVDHLYLLVFLHLNLF